MKKNILYYILIVSGFSFLLWYMIVYGETNFPSHSLQKPKGENTSQGIINEFAANFQHPLSILILQILSIIIVSRVFGFLFTKIKQPAVVGEIIAGILLGPSQMGVVLPDFSAFLFPKSSLPNLQLLSQLGLILFMFIIGAELDIKMLRNKANAAVVISHASIIFPYFLGVCLAYFLYTPFAPDNISFTAFALFMGIAMSITAFPVLARIIKERGMTKTPLGIMALTCAAADDVTAWCILAVVVAIVKAGTMSGAFLTIILSVAYVLFMLLILRPMLKKISLSHSVPGILNKKLVVLVFLIVLGSAYLTEIIGIHALFGAFLAGTIMPDDLNFKKLLIDKIEDVSLVLLLPLFFVFTGLRTQIGLLNSANLWLICGTVILLAIIGKFVGSALAARLVGQTWKNSLSLGALMNTRGLVELVVLNIGYDLGILNPQIFAIMVIMALFTTFMTGPLLDLINKYMPGEEIIEDKAGKSEIGLHQF